MCKASTTRSFRSLASSSRSTSPNLLDSMQKFWLDALLLAIDTKIEQLLKGKG